MKMNRRYVRVRRSWPETTLQLYQIQYNIFQGMGKASEVRACYDICRGIYTKTLIYMRTQPVALSLDFEPEAIGTDVSACSKIQANVNL